MILGVTGTREGMTERQFEFAHRFLRDLGQSYHSLHHGDCVGVDSQMHDAFRRVFQGPIIIHPPLKDGHRAFRMDGGVHLLRPKDYLDRNRDIVDACELLLVFPRPDGVYPSEGGTGYTWKYAIQRHKPHLVVPA